MERKNNINTNSNNNTNNTVATKRNSDIISIERTNNMNTTDLNNIKLNEINNYNLTTEEMMYVMKNNRNTPEAAAKAEVAEKVAKIGVKKKSAKKYNFTESSAKSLGWKKVEAGFDISNAARLFEGLITLFDNKDFTTWMDRSDYKDALLIVAKEIFGEKVSDEDLIKRAHLNVLNLNWGITYINEENDAVLRGTLYNAYRNPFLAAAEIGLITEEDCNRYDEYMLRIK